MSLFTMPAQGREGNEEDLIRVYLMAVRDIDAADVEMACFRFIAGKVKRSNSDFRPSSASLAIEARSVSEHRRGVKRAPKGWMQSRATPGIWRDPRSGDELFLGSNVLAADEEEPARPNLQLVGSDGNE